MVNYCCVSGCARNSKTSKHLFYYGIPKDSPRLEQWLQAIGKKDLLEKSSKKLSHRVCSRHFTPSSIKNKHLCADAVPTLCLPSNEREEIKEESVRVHKDIVCNSCNKPILGFRYKCITCADYDLCSKCEMFEAHSNHYLLRIPKPANYKAADRIIKKLKCHISVEDGTINSHQTDDSSDDDVPIKEYVKQYDSGIDISEDIKSKIRNEVSRVLSIKHSEVKKLKRKELKRKEVIKKRKLTNTEDKCCGTEELKNLVPEVAFADVNDIHSVQNLEIKSEVPINIEGPEIDQPMTDLNLTDTDFILTSLDVP